MTKDMCDGIISSLVPEACIGCLKFYGALMYKVIENEV